ncbi:uncharacterized protein FIBRA_06210 [Fibroporia radiculosa]|uniref:Uncharacterized protein n=1 Tax=Fibroporia radiculosa TaxID=599839 RepID=J4IB51_9APHY|nr:uncharacterized protein FIBRA_06210 [Fibroporia radiculosa]CCM04051.1 predicted protein [Fibroporia radiculosa]
MFRSPSPAQSSTTASDNEDEDFNKSAFFAPPELSITPAQWSTRLHAVPHVSSSSPHSLASTLPPEILIHILKHLHSPTDLYHALLVSRVWCECSVELLWYRPNVTKLYTLVKMMRVLSRANQTFLYAHFIRRLNFLYLGSELNDTLLSRLAHCVRLERLTLINCSSLSDDGLSRVLPFCPNLVALDLTGVTEVSDRSIVALAASTAKLQGINLGGCKKLTDKSIKALAASCPLLRRVKLSNVELITDESVTALACSCPLLLEIDLNNCKSITDASVRDIWTHLTQMRELRLSHCAELTDAAFPMPSRLEPPLGTGPNPFPVSGNGFQQEKHPPLRLSRNLEHLRMLDLTACSQITDDAIEGIISVAPKIRNLVLAKCTQLTDIAVESICNLDKHLHYLHLGHAGGITDRSIRSLARACTRLRYIDLANCLRLTDMSVFELSSLQKLRRIGLVRVSNLTDQAIYALGERHATLERIHLSYCDQISVMSVHFLLQKLPKLTHLSLTGVPAFLRPEVQQFCRDPPQEFNTSQRAAFCVFSGKGVADLRNFLMELFTHITEENNEADETDYEDGQRSQEYRPQYLDEQGSMDDDQEDDEDDDDAMIEYYTRHPNVVVSRGGYRPNVVTPQNVQYEPPRATQPTIARELAMTRERGGTVVPRIRSQQTPSHDPHGGVRRPRGFGQHPIIETSTSPAPSDAASAVSNRSGGTTSSGTTFFRRAYVESPGAARNSVMTPDLVFAEIGHGRGADPGPSTVFMPVPHRRVPELSTGMQPYVVMPGVSPYAYAPTGSSSYPATSGFRLPVSDGDVRLAYPHDSRQILVDSSNSYQHGAGRSEIPAWVPPAQQEEESRSLSSSPTTRELQESIHSALGPQSALFDNREVDGRGRSVKRSLRNTFTAAEHYASSFFFGHGRGPGNGHDGAAGPATSRDSDSHGH